MKMVWLLLRFGADPRVKDMVGRSICHHVKPDSLRNKIFAVSARYARISSKEK